MSIIHNNWKQPNVLQWYVYKLWYTCTMAYYSAIKKKERTIDACNNMGESQMHYTKQRKSVSESYCDFLYMTFWKRQDYRDGEQISGFQG